MQAFDGVVLFQSRSPFSNESAFALSEARLASALSLIAPADRIEETAEFIRMTRGPLSVRVRKLAADQAFYDPYKLSKGARKAEGLLDALHKVAAFVSEDATRAWSLSVLFRKGYAYATNNLALVRTPFASPFAEDFAIPLPAVKRLCELPSIDYIDVDYESKQVTLSSGKLLYRFSMSIADWPDVANFFKGMPKKLPLLPPEMRAATATSAKLSERFTSLSANRVDSQSAMVDSTYEVAFEKGQGMFSARLLALIVEVATHADFSFFPKPIFFKGEGIEGTATGAKQT